MDGERLSIMKLKGGHSATNSNDGDTYMHYSKRLVFFPLFEYTLGQWISDCSSAYLSRGKKLERGAGWE